MDSVVGLLLAHEAGGGPPVEGREGRREERVGARPPVAGRVVPGGHTVHHRHTVHWVHTVHSGRWSGSPVLQQMHGFAHESTQAIVNHQPHTFTFSPAQLNTSPPGAWQGRQVSSPTQTTAFSIQSAQEAKALLRLPQEKRLHGDLLQSSPTSSNARRLSNEVFTGHWCKMLAVSVTAQHKMLDVVRAESVSRNRTPPPRKEPWSVVCCV